MLDLKWEAYVHIFKGRRNLDGVAKVRHIIYDDKFWVQCKTSG
jgi:hypothetical protein